MSKQTIVSGTRQAFGSWEGIRGGFVKADANFTELYNTVCLTWNIMPHASKTVYNLFTADQIYTVKSIRYVPDVVQGSALTATAVKATSTATPASGTTPLHTANGINCNATAHTVQSITLTTTTADLTLAAGDRIGLVLSGALSTGSGCLSIRVGLN